jgi:hypothetical protein
LRKCISRNCPTARRRVKVLRPRIAAGDREGHLADARRGNARREALVRRQEAAAARGRRRVEKTLRDELDLTREAANCSQLRRNFERFAAAPRSRPSTGTTAAPR